MFTRKVIYTFSKYTELLFQAGQATYMRVKQQLKSWFLRAAERLQQQINVQTLEVTACSIHLNDWTKQPLNDPGCQYKMMRKYLKNNILITFYIALCCIICIQVYRSCKQHAMISKFQDSDSPGLLRGSVLSLFARGRLNQKLDFAMDRRPKFQRISWLEAFSLS